MFVVVVIVVVSDGGLRLSFCLALQAAPAAAAGRAGGASAGWFDRIRPLPGKPCWTPPLCPTHLTLHLASSTTGERGNTAHREPFNLLEAVLDSGLFVRFCLFFKCVLRPGIPLQVPVPSVPTGVHETGKAIDKTEAMFSQERDPRFADMYSGISGCMCIAL